MRSCPRHPPTRSMSPGSSRDGMGCVASNEAGKFPEQHALSGRGVAQSLGPSLEALRGARTDWPRYLAVMRRIGCRRTRVVEVLFD